MKREQTSAKPPVSSKRKDKTDISETGLKSDKVSVPRIPLSQLDSDVLDSEGKTGLPGVKTEKHSVKPDNASQRTDNYSDSHRATPSRESVDQGAGSDLSETSSGQRGNFSASQKISSQEARRRRKNRKRSA